MIKEIPNLIRTFRRLLIAETISAIRAKPVRVVRMIAGSALVQNRERRLVVVFASRRMNSVARAIAIRLMCFIADLMPVNVRKIRVGRMIAVTCVVVGHEQEGQTGGRLHLQ